MYYLLHEGADIASPIARSKKIIRRNCRPFKNRKKNVSYPERV